MRFPDPHKASITAPCRSIIAYPTGQNKKVLKEKTTPDRICKRQASAKQGG